MNPDDRSTLRLELRNRRRAVPAPVRIAAAEALAERLLALPCFNHQALSPPRHVAGYWAMDGEIGLHAFQLRLPPSLTYCLPMLHADGRLRFAAWKPGEALVTNRHGIPEPDVDPDNALQPRSMDVVVVPLVGFDAGRHRLGMGGGWYDRSFAFRQSEPAPPWLVGAAFESQRLDAVAAESWDVRLDAVCSERAAYLAREEA